MQRMTRRTYFPAINRYATEVAKSIDAFDEADFGSEFLSPQHNLLDKLLAGLSDMIAALHELEAAEERVGELAAESSQEAANYNAHTVLPCMEALRATVDGLEVYTDRSYWPAPSYNNMLFYV